MCFGFRLSNGTQRCDFYMAFSPLSAINEVENVDQI